MAIKGLSIPVVGKYTESSGTVTYSDGVINPKAVSYAVNVELNEAVKLYADNEVAEESKKSFKQATVTLGTDDLSQDFSKTILGLKEVTEGESTSAITVSVYDDDVDPGFFGLGIIEEHQCSGVDKYRAVMLCKVKFDIPSEAANTRGENVSWQTKTLNATAYRSGEVGTGSGAVKHPWKKEAWFATESAALDWLKGHLGFT